MEEIMGPSVLRGRRELSCVEGGEDFGGGAEEDFVEGFGVERRFGACVDGADAALVGDVDEAGGGVDVAGGSYDEEGGGAVEFGVDVLHGERDFAEPDDVRADGMAAVFAGGEGFFVEGGVGEGDVAAGAAGLEELAVHVVEVLRAGALVEVVYILGAEVEAVGHLAFEIGEGEVAGVGLGRESVSAAHGVEAPDEGWVGVPGFGGGYIFYAMTVPEAAGAAEGGEAALGGDARAGEDEEAVLSREGHEVSLGGLRWGGGRRWGCGFLTYSYPHS